jgi:hypothetical protein
LACTRKSIYSFAGGWTFYGTSCALAINGKMKLTTIEIPAAANLQITSFMGRLLP